MPFVVVCKKRREAAILTVTALVSGLIKPTIRRATCTNTTWYELAAADYIIFIFSYCSTGKLTVLYGLAHLVVGADIRLQQGRGTKLYQAESQMVAATVNPKLWWCGEGPRHQWATSSLGEGRNRPMACRPQRTDTPPTDAKYDFLFVNQKIKSEEYVLPKNNTLSTSNVNAASINPYACQYLYLP